MSVKERVAAILKGSEGVLDENNVAVLGLSRCGKTVFVTLMSHAFDHYFLDKHPEIRAHPKAGRPFLETCENSMRDGEFPERTQQFSRDKIIFEMRSTGATAKTIEFKLPDISGEDYEKMCLGDEIRGEDRVVKIADMDKDKGQTFGHMIYVIYAKMYVFQIDCSKFGEWEKNDTKFQRALTTIQDFKNVAGLSKKGRIETPIAIVLTKTDRLEDREIKPEELVREKMRRFYNTLNDIHTGERAFFMVHVDVKRNSENEIDTSDGVKVAQPLSYSHEEYVNFLWWLHENLLE